MRFGKVGALGVGAALDEPLDMRPLLEVMIHTTTTKIIHREREEENLQRIIAQSRE